MSAGNYPIIMEQGATFYRQITDTLDGSPVDLTGYVIRMQIRNAPNAPTVLELTTANGGITITDAANGIFTLDATPAQTAAVAAGDYEYDLELESTAGVVKRLLSGSVCVSAEITV